MTSRITAIGFSFFHSSNEGHQRRLHGLPRFQRHQDRVKIHRRAPEDLVPSASERAFKIEAQPPPTGGSPMPRAPTGVSGSGISSAAHCMSTGTSRIVGGLF